MGGPRGRKPGVTRRPVQGLKSAGVTRPVHSLRVEAWPRAFPPPQISGRRFQFPWRDKARQLSRPSFNLRPKAADLELRDSSGRKGFSQSPRNRVVASLGEKFAEFLQAGIMADQEHGSRQGREAAHQSQDFFRWRKIKRFLDLHLRRLAPRRERFQRLQSSPGARHPYQIRRNSRGSNVAPHGCGGFPPALVQRAVVIGNRRVIPCGFCVAEQEELSLHFFHVHGAVTVRLGRNYGGSPRKKRRMGPRGCGKALDAPLTKIFMPGNSKANCKLPQMLASDLIDSGVRMTSLFSPQSKKQSIRQNQPVTVGGDMRQPRAMPHRGENA